MADEKKITLDDYKGKGSLSLKKYLEPKGLKLSLEEFIRICNECKWELVENPQDNAYKMGEDFKNLEKYFENKPGSLGVHVNKGENKLKENFETINNETGETIGFDNYLFYLFLKEKCEKNKYTFKIEKQIINVDIDVFKPFNVINGEEYFSQKWHVLISVLALRDAANQSPLKEELYDKLNEIYLGLEKNKNDNDEVCIYSDGITICPNCKESPKTKKPNGEKISVHGKKKYPSKTMMKWIHHAIDEYCKNQPAES